MRNILPRDSARNFDVSKYTKNSADKSNLNLAFDVKGKGLTSEGIEGTFDMKVDKSFYSHYHIPPTAVNIKLGSIGSKNGHISVATDYFDLDAKGTFNLSQIGEVMAYNISLVSNELKRKLIADTVTGITGNLNKNFSDLDFTYNFTAKNIQPLTEIFDTSGIQLIGNIKGNVKNSKAGFFADAKLDLNNFIYNDTNIVMRNVKGELDFRNDYGKTVPS